MQLPPCLCTEKCWWCTPRRKGVSGEKSKRMGVGCGEEGRDGRLGGGGATATVTFVVCTEHLQLQGQPCFQWSKAKYCCRRCRPSTSMLAELNGILLCSITSCFCWSQAQKRLHHHATTPTGSPSVREPAEGERLASWRGASLWACAGVDPWTSLVRIQFVCWLKWI